MHDICIALVGLTFSLGLGYSFQELNGILPKTFLTQASNSFETFRGISFWACLCAASHRCGMTTTMPWRSFFDFDFMSLLLYKSIRLMCRHINLAKSCQRNSIDLHFLYGFDVDFMFKFRFPQIKKSLSHISPTKFHWNSAFIPYLLRTENLMSFA